MSLPNCTGCRAQIKDNCKKWTGKVKKRSNHGLYQGIAETDKRNWEKPWKPQNNRSKDREWKPGSLEVWQNLMSNEQKQLWGTPMEEFISIRMETDRQKPWKTSVNLISQSNSEQTASNYRSWALPRSYTSLLFTATAHLTTVCTDAVSIYEQYTSNYMHQVPPETVQTWAETYRIQAMIIPVN